MKDLKAIRGKALITQLIAEGEHSRQDFKYAVSDSPKIARSISAFANCRGGRLLIGVKDNGVIAGVRNEEDIYVVEQAAERYCMPPQNVEFRAYRVDGLHVISATVEEASERPVYAIEADGRRRAYFRVADENIAAHPLMVRAWEARHCASAAIFDPAGPLSRVLAEIAGSEGVDDVKRLATALHISVERAEDAVVNLLAMNLAEFRHNGSQFILYPKDGNDADS